MRTGGYLQGCQRLGNLILKVWSILVAQQLIRVVLLFKLRQPQPIGRGAILVRYIRHPCMAHPSALKRFLQMQRFHAHQQFSCGCPCEAPGSFKLLAMRLQSA